MSKYYQSDYKIGDKCANCMNCSGRMVEKNEVTGPSVAAHELLDEDKTYLQCNKCGYAPLPDRYRLIRLS